MKKGIYLFLTLIIVACSTDDNNNVDDTQAEWLYVHTAIEANATNSTTLVIPFTEDIFAFTDRPDREHKYISAYEFVSYWSDDATNSFQFDPPNAVLTSVVGDGIAEVEVVIIGASTDGDNITYTIQNPKLTENATFEDVSLFVDGNGDNNLAIGQAYQGGIIAHLDSTGQYARGLIAATADYNGVLNWQGAMDYCNGLDVGTYDDEFNWYLPSVFELNILYENRAAIGGFTDPTNGSTENFYWSSTENGNNNAWKQDFGDGLQTSFVKDDTNRVRAVRAF